MLTPGSFDIFRLCFHLDKNIAYKVEQMHF